MSLLEKKVERDVVDWWKERGGEQFKINILGRRGLPDRVFLKRGGKPIFIEFKRGGEEVTPLQAYYHKRLQDLGYECYVCWTSSVAKAILARP